MPIENPISLAMNKTTKVLLVMDVVESVRLMEQDQDDFVRRWQELVQQAEQQILPLHGGRIVKSLGDGLMLEFASAQGCLNAAFAIQQFSRNVDAERMPASRMHLRMGAHLAEFVTDKHDIYGTDVNLTARFATLAGPGDLVVSAELRDCIPTGLDADIEDLGECHLKHLTEPVQAYRAWPVGEKSPTTAEQTVEPDLRPTIAVIPFEARSNEPEHFVIGELLADGVIAQLSRSADLRVISRLSTSAFRGRPNPMAEVETRLGASYLLSGSYVASGGRLLIFAQLSDARSNEVIWADRLSGDTSDLLQTQSELVNTLATASSRALVDSEVKQSLAQPLPRLDSGSLLLGGIALMHRSSMRDFDRSRQVLEALLDRHNRSAAPRAWLAKWHTMRVIRGLSNEPGKDTQLALEQTRRALDLAPGNALSLAIEGYARCQLLGEADTAKHRIGQAIELNPNEPMAWLFKSVLSTMWGSAQDSIVEAEYASSLSPIDPLNYYFDLLLASALLTDNQHERAIIHAKRSLRANRHHSPTFRVLVTAQFESGQLDDAKTTLNALLLEEPHLTVSSYLAMGSANSITRQRCVAAMRALGLSN